MNSEDKRLAMTDEQQLIAAANLLQHLKTTHPEISTGDLLSVLALAALTAQGPHIVHKVVFNAGT